MDRMEGAAGLAGHGGREQDRVGSVLHDAGNRHFGAKLRVHCTRCERPFGAGSAHSAALDLPPELGAAILCQPCAATVIADDAAAGALIRKLHLGARTGAHRVRRSAERRAL